MVFGYGSFGITPAASQRMTLPRDKASLIRLGAPALADAVQSLTSDLDIRTKERDTRATERDQAVGIATTRERERDTARKERDTAQAERETFRQQASRIPGLEQVAAKVPALEQTVRDLSVSAGRVPSLEKSVAELSVVAQQVPGLRTQVKAASDERDAYSRGLQKAVEDLGREKEKTLYFEKAAGGLKLQVDGLSGSLESLNKMLAQVQADYEASLREVGTLSQSIQSERNSRLAAENNAEARGVELSIARTELANALNAKDVAVAAAARQWKEELDAALRSANESLEEERKTAREERDAVEERRQDLGQKYEELLLKYNKLARELEIERERVCEACPAPVECPVCEDCPAPQPCPECGKQSKQSASTDAGMSPWTLLLAAGGGYLMAKSIGK